MVIKDFVKNTVKYLMKILCQSLSKQEGKEQTIEIIYTKILVVNEEHEWDISYFKMSEFFCKCGEKHEQIIDVRFVHKLEKLREVLGFPLFISSGYRCVKHNKNVGGKENSQHLYGKAADIISMCDGKLNEIIVAAKKLKFGGIGIYRTFIHLDNRDGEVRWEG